MNPKTTSDKINLKGFMVKIIMFITITWLVFLVSFSFFLLLQIPLFTLRYGY